MDFIKIKQARDNILKSKKKGDTTVEPPIERDINITLEELLRGCIKTETVTRKVSKYTRQEREDKVFRIEIKPGCPHGEQKIFPGQGDESSNGRASDVIFTIYDVPHLHFERKGCHLQHTVIVDYEEEYSLRNSNPWWRIQLR